MKYTSKFSGEEIDSILDSVRDKQDAIPDLETIRNNAKNASDTIARMVESGYLFAGIATIDTNPRIPDAKVFYIANGKGTYEKFGGINVTEDDVVVLYWDSAWHKVATGIASQEKLSELDEKINGVDEVIETNIDIAASVSKAFINGNASIGSSTYAILNSSTEDRCVGFFPCEQGKKYRINIPLNTNTSSRSVAISRTSLSGSISSITSVDGIILDSPKGGLSPIDYTIESAPMTGYIAVSYHASGGLPTCVNLEKQHSWGVIAKIDKLSDDVLKNKEQIEDVSTRLYGEISNLSASVDKIEDDVIGSQREITEDVTVSEKATYCYLNAGNSLGGTINILRSSASNRCVGFYPCIKGRRYEIHIPKCEYNVARTVSYVTQTYEGQLIDENKNLGGYVLDSPKGGETGYNDYVIESAMSYPYIAVSYDANGGVPTVVMKYTEVKDGMKEELESLKAFKDSTSEFLAQFCGEKKSSTIFQKLGFLKTNNVSHTRCCKIDGNDFYVGYNFGIMKGSLSLYGVPELYSENIFSSADIVSGHTVTGIDVNDDYLFVTTRDNSAGKTIPASGVGGYLYVLDKASLEVVTKIDLKWSVVELYAQGKTNSAEPIYSLTDMTTGDPDTNEVSSGIIKYKAMSCKVVGNILYIALQLKGWCAFDITNPTSPNLLYYFSTASGAKECQHIAYWEKDNNKYVAFSGFASGVHIFDVTTIGSPIFKGSSIGGVYSQSNHEMFGIWVNYPYLYLTYSPLQAYQTAENATKGLFVYDITDVDNFASTIRYEPIPKSEWGTMQDGDGQPNFLAVHNGVAICNIDNVGLASFRVKDKAKFTKAMLLGNGVSIRPICCSEDGIYMACTESAENQDDFGLYFYRIFDIEKVE